METLSAVATSLFSTLDIRGVSFRNRIAVSPMCQYSAEDGLPNDWHLVHLGSRAVGGAALVIAEATAVSPAGRISPGDLGIWSDRHVEAFRPVARFLKQNGAAPGIQIAHAGRKASTAVPWEGGAVIARDQGGWETVAPGPLPFRSDDPVPHALTRDEIGSVVHSFATAARRSLDAGFEVLEIHGAHGYLLNEFYSPLANHRADEYGGSFENRTRIVREVVEAVRKEWPENLPLFLRISGTDYADGGWTVEDSLELARMVRRLGVDLIDCSSGGIVPHVRIPVGPGYQVPIAERVRQ
jgi:2,4-dienoyl-CoA reductase-like NADH-dependent reductase (Old Yellow Enzyme family)